MEKYRTIISKLEDWAGQKVLSTKTKGGDDGISKVDLLTFEKGNTCFLKTGNCAVDVFEKEAKGLHELRKAKAIRVPEVLYVDQDCLLLEEIHIGWQSPDFFSNFGRQLARMHQYGALRFGFPQDNYIGSTPQINVCNKFEAENWCDFFYNKRLLYQYKLAESKGLVGPELKKGFILLENRIEEILEGSEEKPALLHGDLWAGNFLCDSHSQPCVFDPAVYYGHREAELAMTRLFGGFDASFYSSYQRTYPLPEGYDYRQNIYMLYHVLNHLNLFGDKYYGQAVKLLDFYFD
ncbi:fructosamine kinase family protein [Ancylomarina sp. 16SWW S1-10-2]|uniref:fructosamine kinase family protein n=1 Tax=Ancylomarina sp. 16SWW S1-10-2 TaxID=2499681 RepID=UPI0012AE8B83|nr:fructosamine kinase family protein [Ancylomarina sp. 16SWW S1-10-2]MRT93601.1 fructosamine kinase [Ancylomarina sp. 16SWW S1-10-2]